MVLLPCFTPLADSPRVSRLGAKVSGKFTLDIYFRTNIMQLIDCKHVAQIVLLYS